jgi:hypothetical protein
VRYFAFPAVALTAAIASSVAAAPKAFTPAARYTVRVKMKDTTGVSFVPIAEVIRDGGKVTTKALAAPALDKLADELEQRWHAWMPPASITMTETLASDTGMNPQYRAYSATFTSKDGLYQAAVIKQFADKYGYSILGLSSVHFIIYDASAEYPPNAHDRASTHSNFRKNPGGLPYDSNGHDSVFLSISVRPAGSTDDKRVSATDATIAVGHHYDEGTVQCGWLDLAQNGSIAFHKTYLGQQFVEWSGALTPQDTDVAVYDHGTYKYLPVKKDSAWNLEAQLVSSWEGRNLYDISPAIDPVVFR